MRSTLSLRYGIAAAIGSGSLLTLLVGVTSTLPPGAGHAGLHVAVQTALTVILALAALLVYARFRRCLGRHDLVMTAGLCVLAMTSLGFSAVPAVMTGVPAATAAWGGVLGGGLGASLVTAAAFMPAREARRPGAATRRWLGGCALATCTIAVTAALAGDRLPAPVASHAAPGDAFAAHPVIGGLDVAIMILFAATAVGLTRQAVRRDDGVIGWLAIAAVFATFAQVNEVIHPSVATGWFADADVLLLAAVVCLLAGGAKEIGLARGAFAAKAALAERQRIARDLHDGTAQDLAFIVQAGRRLAEREETPASIERLVTAAQQALDHTREAIADASGPGAESLTAALRRAVQEVAEREDVRAEVVGAADLRVPPSAHAALRHLVREAVTNAIRHGGASRIRVSVHDGPQLAVQIDDNGRGFDPAAVRGVPGHFGLVGMSERAAALGGELRIASQPGRGTEVLVVLPGSALAQSGEVVTQG